MARVIFDLEVDEDGWPPAASERVWAFDLGGDLYQVDNAPWFVPGVAVGDVVRAVPPTPDAHPVFVDMERLSDHSTVRVICFRTGPLAGDLGAAVDAFTQLGVYAEGMHQYGMVALDIPLTADLRAVVQLLGEGARDRSWTWEVSRWTRELEALFVELDPPR